MAVLAKIRKRSGLLLLAIGFALLAFVVQDLFTKGFKSLSKDVGSVNGKNISFEDHHPFVLIPTRKININLNNQI